MVFSSSRISGSCSSRSRIISRSWCTRSSCISGVLSNIPLSINPCIALRARGTEMLHALASRSTNPANNSTGIWFGSTSRRENSRNTISSSGFNGISIAITHPYPLKKPSHSRSDTPPWDKFPSESEAAPRVVTTPASQCASEPPPGAGLAEGGRSSPETRISPDHNSIPRSLKKKRDMSVSSGWIIRLSLKPGP